MKKIIAGGILLLNLLIANSCKKDGGLFCQKPDGEVKTELRNVNGFSKIDLETAADLTITQGADYKVEVSAAQNLLSIIETKKVGDRLVITLKKNTCIKHDDAIQINVVLPLLKRISISGSGEILIPSKMETSDLSLDISGSGDIRIDSLISKNLDVSISGAGNLFVQSTDTISNSNIKISGSGELDLFNAFTLKSKVEISGSGNCKVSVIEKLIANISGSGNVLYIGNPILIQNATGSGSVKPY